MTPYSIAGRADSRSTFFVSYPEEVDASKKYIHSLFSKLSWQKSTLFFSYIDISNMQLLCLNKNNTAFSINPQKPLLLLLRPRYSLNPL